MSGVAALRSDCGERVFVLKLRRGQGGDRSRQAPVSAVAGRRCVRVEDRCIDSVVFCDMPHNLNRRCAIAVLMVTCMVLGGCGSSGSSAQSSAPTKPSCTSSRWATRSRSASISAATVRPSTTSTRPTWTQTGARVTTRICRRIRDHQQRSAPGDHRRRPCYAVAVAEPTSSPCPLATTTRPWNSFTDPCDGHGGYPNAHLGLVSRRRAWRRPLRIMDATLHLSSRHHDAAGRETDADAGHERLRRHHWRSRCTRLSRSCRLPRSGRLRPHDLSHRGGASRDVHRHLPRVQRADGSQTPPRCWKATTRTPTKPATN